MSTIPGGKDKLALDLQTESARLGIYFDSLKRDVSINDLPIVTKQRLVKMLEIVDRMEHVRLSMVLLNTGDSGSLTIAEQTGSRLLEMAL